jgi:hypothetical protein
MILIEGGWKTDPDWHYWYFGRLKDWRVMDAKNHLRELIEKIIHSVKSDIFGYETIYKETGNLRPNY